MSTFDVRFIQKHLTVPIASSAALVALAAVVAASPSAAQEHEHAGGQDHSHAGGAHFVHPLIAESISPDTKLRLDYMFRDPGSESEMELEGEYAFHPTMSVEVGMHVDPAAADLGDTHLLFKFVNQAFTERGVLLGYGLSLGLPTGGGHEHGPTAVPDATEPDHDHAEEDIYEFAPFLNGGIMVGDLELVGWTRFRIPTNQEFQNDVGTSVGYNVSALYHLGARVQALLELDGSGGLSGAEAGHRVTNLAPGLKVRPFAGTNMSVGLGVGIPLTDERDFDTRALASAFYHF